MAWLWGSLCCEITPEACWRAETSVAIPAAQANKESNICFHQKIQGQEMCKSNMPWYEKQTAQLLPPALWVSHGKQSKAWLCVGSSGCSPCQQLPKKVVLPGQRWNRGLPQLATLFMSSFPSPAIMPAVCLRYAELSTSLHQSIPELLWHLLLLAICTFYAPCFHLTAYLLSLLVLWWNFMWEGSKVASFERELLPATI